MDNLNVQLYKDSNDLIVVFKNIDTSLETLITTMLGNISVKSVPALDSPVEPEIKKPDLAKFEEVIPEFLADDYNEVTEKNEEEIIEEIFDEATISDPTSIQNIVSYISLYGKIKMNKVHDKNACKKLLAEYKKTHESEFGRTCCSTFKKEELGQMLIEFNKFIPAIITEKIKTTNLNEYIKSTPIGTLRYLIKGLIWYNMK